MNHVVATIAYAPDATPHEGNPPPGFTVRATAGTVTVLDGASAFRSGDASYDSEVTMTGETSFVEDGTMVVGDLSLSIDTIGEGVFEPSADAGTLQGAVLWHVAGRSTDGEVRGIVTSSFMLDAASGAAKETQVLRLFVAS